MNILRFVLIGFLALISSDAMAQWTKLGNNSIGAGNDNYETIYVDYKTATKLDGKVQMWFLRSYSKYWQAPYHSVKQLLEFDCQNNRFRLLEELIFFDQMGSGRPMGGSGRNSNAGWWILNNKSDTMKFNAGCKSLTKK